MTDDSGKLGRLERITDIRSVWEDEAREFTPWLAKQENIVLLGETIGIELQVESVEKAVGPFRADILCKDTINDNWVLIENQLERTNHTHLGQLMTYAAGLHTVTVVWISPKITDEHRAALDWLNEITGEGFNFFGLEIELWRIGNSPVAPKFNVVSQPNDWVRSVQASTSSGTLSDVKQMQLEYWTEFRDYMEDNSSIRCTKPSPQTWMTFAIGRSGFWLDVMLSTWDVEANSAPGVIRAQLVIGDKHYSDAYFRMLYEQKDELEREIGEPLVWYAPDGQTTRKIGFKKQVDVTDRSRWPEYREWMRIHLERLQPVLVPRVRRLSIEEDEPNREME